MSDPVSQSNAVRAFPILGQGETFHLSPTNAERQQIAAARTRRARQGYAFQRSDNSRHRLVGFDYNKATLKPAHLRYLRDAVMKEARSFGGRPRFWVCGYASRSGGAQGNLALSGRRAQAVAAYLKKLVPNARVDVQAAGESRPYRAGAADGSEDFMDRAVEIGVARAGGNTVVANDARNRAVEQQHFMRQTFQRFAPEAHALALLKAIDFPSTEDMWRVLSGRNKTHIRNGILQHILNRSWPIIHQKYPDLSGRQVIDALRSWHQGLKDGR